MNRLVGLGLMFVALTACTSSGRGERLEKMTPEYIQQELGAKTDRKGDRVAVVGFIDVNGAVVDDWMTTLRLTGRPSGQGSTLVTFRIRVGLGDNRVDLPVSKDGRNPGYKPELTSLGTVIDAHYYDDDGRAHLIEEEVFLSGNVKYLTDADGGVARAPGPDGTPLYRFELEKVRLDPTE